MTVKVNNQSAHAFLDAHLEEYVHLCEYVFLQEAITQVAELSLTFVDDEEMEALNSDYRSKDGATDVLSFPCDDAGAEDMPFLLGDIVIAPKYASGKFETASDEDLHETIRLLIVHGILHLLGYDHEDSEESAQAMEAREQEILSDWRELLKAEPRTHASCGGGCCDR